MAPRSAREVFRKRKMKGDKTPAVDAYIEAAPAYAKPILGRIRKAFHFGCPDLRETIEQDVPYFEHQGLLGGMAASPQHVELIFTKGRLLEDPEELLEPADPPPRAAARFRSLREMPPQEVLIAYVREAAALDEEGAEGPRREAD